MVCKKLKREGPLAACVSPIPSYKFPSVPFFPTPSFPFAAMTVSIYPVVLSSLEGVQQRAQVQFPNDIVWDILWDSVQSRVIVYTDPQQLFEVQGTTLQDAMQAIGYNSATYVIDADYFELNDPNNMLGLLGQTVRSIELLQLPISANFLLKIKVFDRNDQ